MRMALPGMNRKEAKREQARPRSISQKSPMEAPSWRNPQSPVGSMNSPGAPQDVPMAISGDLGHGLLPHPEGSLVSGEHKEMGEGVPRGTKQSLGIDKCAQHPPPAWADEV